MLMQPHFDKANEIYFRLGIIYKQQQKYDQSLECFKYIVSSPPRPLTEEDIWFQIGHVHEQQKDVSAAIFDCSIHLLTHPLQYDSAKGAYQKVLQRDPHHAKVLQQLGWLHHQESPHYHSQEQAIEYLEKSVSSDNSDAQSWYLLGRCYMSQQKYPKAYEAYQQAVYRDGRNPTFWCSIGVLYYQINQYRDALDAYSRAIRLNPYISEVWYDLGTLYESCNNQTADALDAYQRAYDLDPSNDHIKARLSLLRNGGQSTGMTNQGAAPEPQDVHPQQYQAPGVNGPPAAQWGPPGGVNPPAHGGIPPQQAQPAPVQDWNRHLADIQQPQPQQPQPANPYDHREPARAAPIQRQLSPRQEPLRQYQEQPRYQPTRHSPPPALSRPPPNAYPPAPQALPQPQPSAAPVNGASHHMNGSQDPGLRYAPGASQNAPAPGAAPYGRGNSPPPEIKPIAEGRQSSPGPNYPAQHYQHHPNTSQSVGIAAGAPPPAAALAAAEAAARDRDEPPISASGGGFKRPFEADDEHYMGPRKHAANGEARSRLEDQNHRRPSPPDSKRSPARGIKSPPMERRPSPPNDHTRSESVARLEEKRKADETYRPSEAAHHPPALPSIPSQGPPPSHSQTAPQTPSEHPQAPVAAPVRDERKEPYEAAARKLDVDEDYDDEPQDDKRKEMAAGHTSPRANNVAGPTKTEIEAN